MNPWKRVERWLELNAPKLREALQDPVRDDVIDELEGALSLTLPTDVVRLYQIHNGQYVGRLDGDWQIIALEAMLVQWQVQKRLLDQGAFARVAAKPVGPVRPLWWSDKWLPFGYNGTGDLRCIDMAPIQGGVVGQIITYWHDRPERVWLAGSMTEWLDGFADDLEADLYVVENELTLRRRSRETPR